MDADSDGESSIEFEDRCILTRLLKRFERFYLDLTQLRATTIDMEDLVKRVWQRCKLMNSLRTDFNDITEIQNKMMKRAVRQLTEKNLERITKEVFDAVKRLLQTRWAYFSLTDLQKARLQLVA